MIKSNLKKYRGVKMITSYQCYQENDRELTLKTVNLKLSLQIYCNKPVFCNLLN
jgi:hypothetical protein